MTDVVVHVSRHGDDLVAGTAHFTRDRRSVTTTFTYEPFVWTKTPEQILAKANRQPTSETRH